MSMADRIKELRKSLGYNQLDFAKEIGIKQTSLSLIETGKNALTEQNIKLICMAFKVNERWLRFGEGARSKSATGESAEQQRFVSLFEQLNTTMQEVVIKHLEELVLAQESLSAENELKEDKNDN